MKEYRVFLLMNDRKWKERRDGFESKEEALCYCLDIKQLPFVRDFKIKEVYK